PLLTGVEAVEKGKVTCHIVSVTSTVARIGFQGEVVGATVGAAAGVEVDGFLLYDREQKLVSRIDVTQTEKRAIGAVSPGLDVAAKVVLSRRNAYKPAHTIYKDLAGLPVEANPANRLLMLEAPAWNPRMYHDRRWLL